MRLNNVNAFLVGEAFMRAAEAPGVELARVFAWSVLRRNNNILAE